jgi:hypothetical protein
VAFKIILNLISAVDGFDRWLEGRQPEVKATRRSCTGFSGFQVKPLAGREKHYECQKGCPEYHGYKTEM